MLSSFSQKIKNWGKDLGFQQVGITNVDLRAYEKNFLEWLKRKFHGEMTYMSVHGEKRYQPDKLIPGTIRVVTARMDYFPAHTKVISILNNPEKAYISRYALGRDYHKLIRARLAALARKISSETKQFGFRAFTDSAPILEKPLAEKSGLGWIGKSTNLINKQAGSWFFLGEIFTDMPLDIDQASTNHCGSCAACLTVCPTQAIVAPYQLDARRCISYLTIELKGSIPIPLRPLIGNRIYGCDDCQLVCPWNKFSKFTNEKDFHPRHDLATSDLLMLFQWNEKTFMHKTEGSAIRRIGYKQWMRNIAIALGNAPFDENILRALFANTHSALGDIFNEHVGWAIAEQFKKSLTKKTMVCS